jgi:hypothetical protein
MKIGSYIISYILVTLLLFNITRVSLTYAYFELDPVGFIEKLCENTDKPELACNGKCQLMKVSQSQDKEHKTPASILEFKELLLYANPIIVFAFSNISVIKKNPDWLYKNLYSHSNPYHFFHPPRV